MEYKSALETKATLAKRIKEMAAEFEANDKEWKDDTTAANFEKLNADYQANEQIVEKHRRATEVAEAAAKASAESGIPLGSETEYRGDDASLRGKSVENVRAIALQGRLLAHVGERLQPEHEAAIEATGGSVEEAERSREMNIPLLDTMSHKRLQAGFRKHGSDFQNAALVTTTGTLGGNIVPPETMLSSVEINMLAYGGILQAADTMTTDTGEPMSWPTVDDTGNKGRRLAENAPHDDNAGGGTSGDGGPNPTFNKVTWSSYDYTSDMILVPYRLLRDSAASLPEILGALIGERLGRILGEECTTGTGSAQPNGIITAAGVGVTAASTTAITADEVVALQHSVDSAYRAGASFMANDNTALALRLLKDGNGQPIWQSVWNQGAPDTLLGKSLVYSHDMANAAVSSKPLLFGDISKYKVRRVSNIRFYRLEERYRQRDQDGFVAMMSADGGLLNAGTNPVKVLQMAAS